MNWRLLRIFPKLDTRAHFVIRTPKFGALLDLGSSDGETLNHFRELRPDLRLYATDIAGTPQNYPQGCEFFRSDLNRDSLHWEEGSMDAVTCLHLVEHLEYPKHALSEAYRVLKPGCRLYVETPHPKTLFYDSPSGKSAGTFTLNFFDDITHTRPMPVGALATIARDLGFDVIDSGISRNWLFGLLWPFFKFLPPSRKKFTSLVHWRGWSAFIILERKHS